MPVNTTIYPKANMATLTHPVLARQLDTNLIASGWTRVFADAAAIGTGSEASPKFDSVAYTSGAVFGRAVYRMPLAGLINAWFIELIWKWGTTNGYGGLLVATATGCDSAGVLTGASAQRGSSGGPATGATFDGAVATSEYGFLYCLGGHKLICERSRTISNSYEDDVIIGATAGGSYFALAGWNVASSGRSVRRSFATGEFAERELAYLLGGNGTTLSVPATISVPDNNIGYPIGPFPCSGGLRGSTRLWLETATGDAVLGSEQSFEVDGTNRQYYCLDSSSGTLGGTGTYSRTLVAKQ